MATEQGQTTAPCSKPLMASGLEARHEGHALGGSSTTPPGVSNVSLGNQHKTYVARQGNDQTASSKKIVRLELRLEKQNKIDLG